MKSARIACFYSFGLLLLLLVSSSPGLSQELSTKTKINDAAQKKQLLGRHMISLQWIGFGKEFGTATVTDKNGVLTIKGEQVRKGTPADYLKIDGIITEVNAKTFKFRGTVKTKVSTIAGGKECVRDKDLTFAIKGKRRYWRMQEMNNPCDSVADYVDVYLR